MLSSKSNQKAEFCIEIGFDKGSKNKQASHCE